MILLEVRKIPSEKGRSGGGEEWVNRMLKKGRGGESIPFRPEGGTQLI